VHGRNSSRGASVAAACTPAQGGADDPNTHAGFDQAQNHQAVRLLNDTRRDAEGNEGGQYRAVKVWIDVLADTEQRLSGHVFEPDGPALGKPMRLAIIPLRQPASVVACVFASGAPFKSAAIPDLNLLGEGFALKQPEITLVALPPI
jgi:hypothetical protein